jgi:hypothetical protein
MNHIFQSKNELTNKHGIGNNIRALLIGAGLVLSVFSGLHAQSHDSGTSAVKQPLDKGIPFPPSEPSQPVRQDATALAVVRSYQQAVGKADWVDLEAAGAMILEARQSQGTLVKQDATLQILGNRGYRLDVETPKGTISIRMDGANGAMRPPGVRVIPIDPQDAASGLLAFPQLQDPSFPNNTVSLIDQGTVLVDGANLHRITVEAPWISTSSKGQSESGISITDLYFDPKTKMLFKSANVLQGADRRLAHYIKVVSYGDYRPVSDVQIPFSLSESLNGRRDWMLQLHSVQFSTGLKETLFSF